MSLDAGWELGCTRAPAVADEDESERRAPSLSIGGDGGMSRGVMLLRRWAVR